MRTKDIRSQCQFEMGISTYSHGDRFHLIFRAYMNGAERKCLIYKCRAERTNERCLISEAHSATRPLASVASTHTQLQIFRRRQRSLGVNQIRLRIESQIAFSVNIWTVNTLTYISPDKLFC